MFFRFIPRKGQHIADIKYPLRAISHHASSQKASLFPLVSFKFLHTLVPRIEDGSELGRSASLEVLKTYSDTPRRNAHELFDVRFYTIYIIGVFF